MQSNERDRNEAYDEHTMVARLRTGDDEAFEWLVRTYGGRMLSVARRVTGHDEDARDVVQNAFIAVFRKIDTFDGRSQLGTWLHRIVVNTALMQRRTLRRRPEVSIEDLLPRFLGDGHQADPITAPEADAWALDRDLMKAALTRALNQLPAIYRDVFVCRDVEELSVSETAEALDLNPATVKTRLHRARMALHTLIRKELTPAAARPVVAAKSRGNRPSILASKQVSVP